MATATLEKTANTMTEQPARTREGASKAAYGNRTPVDLHSRARDAAARYLELRGYEVLERGYPYGDDNGVDIVAWDADTLVFVDVVAKADKFPDGGYSAARRAVLESVALAFIAECEYKDGDDDVPVRFDTICVIPAGKSRAFLRHQTNALGTM